MDIKNIDDAIDYIYSFMSKKTIYKKNFNHINNVEEVLNIFNYKQTFKVIHITGTKGKGSTTLTLSRMLKSAGYKTGAFISPHIINERERISINDKWISKESFIHIVNKIKYVIDNRRINITVFEIFTIIGLYYFYINNVDYACIEVGIGGRLDCTNIVNSSISIITSISYDHIDILGNTIEEITTEKSGIIKPNSIVISTYQEQNSINIIERVSNNNNCKLYILKRDFDNKILENSNKILKFEYIDNYEKYMFYTTLLGEHQAENISLAFKAFRILLSEFNFKKEMIEKIYLNAIDSLKDFNINARLTFMQREPDIIVDGAHNAKSLERVLETIYKWYDDIIILFAPLSDKDLDRMCFVLKKYDSIIIILSNNHNNIYKKTDNYKVYEYLKDKSNLKYISDFNKAVKYMKELSKEKKLPALVIGSLYSASDYINLSSIDN